MHDDLDHGEVHKAADELIRALWPRVEEITSRKDVGALTALITVARPFLRSALSRIEGVAPTVDKRMSPYTVKAMFWDISHGEAEAELVAEAEEEVVYGLGSTLERLALWIAELHDGEELSDEADMAEITKRLPTLRTTVTRGNGSGAFRQYYHADGAAMLAHATVQRAPDEEA